MTEKKISAIDLFCGVGGLTHGLEKAGINVKAGYDLDENCKYPYEENNEAEFVKKDVKNLEASEIQERLDDDGKTLIAGCAPCQPFSSLTNSESGEDERWWLLNHFSELVEEVEPDYVTMENVANLKGEEIYKSFKDKLETLGYSVTAKVVKAKNYGVPQSRRRLVLIASKRNQIKLIDSSKDIEPTVRNHIEDMPPLEAGERSEEDPLHWCAGLSKTNLKRIRQSEPGGTWEDWDEELLLKCHKKDSGSTYKSVYGRMVWDEPAPTITTQFYGYGNGRFGHPSQDRAISLREGAILQTFPKEYKFIDPEKEKISKTEIGRWIGNAVPVDLAKAIGESIISS